MIIILSLIFKLTFNQAADFKADKYTNISLKDTLILEGNVNILSNNNDIKAQKVELNTKTKQFIAEQEVSLKNQDMTIEAEILEGNFNTEQGVLTNAKVSSKFDTVYGSKINKIDNYKYKLNNGTFTSCKNNPPDWSFYGKNMDIDFKGYAKIDDGLLKTNDFPLLYFPYLVLPLMQERQSGILMPRFGFSKEGFNIEEDLFIAINRSNDATFTVGHYQNRGYLTGFEYRTRLSETSYINANFFNIFDNTFKNSYFQDTMLNKSYRNSFKQDSVFELEENTYFKSQIRYVSDTNIPRDFHNKIEGNLDPALDNKFFIYKHTNNLLFSASINYYQNLTNPNPTSSNSNQIHKLPELNIKMANTKYRYFMFENDLSYLNIYRAKSGFDDLNNNLIFDEGDKIRTAQIFYISPKISIPITSKYISINPSYRLRYHYYILEDDINSSKALNEFKVNFKQDIYRTFRFSGTSNIKAIKHTITPYIEHTYINEFKSMNVNTPRIDSFDFINLSHYIKYGLNNRLTASIIEKKIKKICATCEETTEEEIKEQEHVVIQPLSWNIYQLYNIENSKFNNAYSDLWFRYNIYNLIIKNYLNIETKKVASNLNAMLKFDNNYYTNINYTVDKTRETASVDQLKFAVGFKYWQFYSNMNLIYNNLINGSFKDKIQEKYFDLTYNPNSSCWYLTTSFSNRYDKPGTEINFLINFIISGQNIGFGNNLSYFNTM